AFAAQPGPAEDPAQGHYALAANAAVRASLGKAANCLDVDQVAAADRDGLRQKALEWLRADLKVCARVLARHAKGGKTAGDRPESPLANLAAAAAQTGLLELFAVCDRLNSWPTDPTLAVVREDKELARLPAGEQAAWRQFWADVQTLRKQTKGYYSKR